MYIQLEYSYMFRGKQGVSKAYFTDPDFLLSQIDNWSRDFRKGDKWVYFLTPDNIRNNENAPIIDKLPLYTGAWNGTGVSSHEFNDGK